MNQEYTSNGISKEAYVKKEVILSASTIESQKLLILFAKGQAEIKKRYKITIIQKLQVGQNMRNRVGMLELVFSLTWNFKSLEEKKKDVQYFLKKKPF